MRRCSCLTCREFGAFYKNRVLFMVVREDEEVHVGVDELTAPELARFTAEGTDTEKAEITDWLSEPCPARVAPDGTSARAA